MTYAIILLSLIDALQTWPNRSKESNRFARWFLDRGLVVYAIYKVLWTALLCVLGWWWFVADPLVGREYMMFDGLAGAYLIVVGKNLCVLMRTKK